MRLVRCEYETALILTTYIPAYQGWEFLDFEYEI
jgi:hypothetical protein